MNTLRQCTRTVAAGLIILAAVWLLVLAGLVVNGAGLGPAAFDGEIALPGGHWLLHAAAAYALLLTGLGLRRWIKP